MHFSTWPVMYIYITLNVQFGGVYDMASSAISNYIKEWSTRFRVIWLISYADL